MNKGFNKDFDVELEIPKSDIDGLLRKYKKLKKYQKSSFHEIEKLNGNTTVIDKMIQESNDDPITSHD